LKYKQDFIEIFFIVFDKCQQFAKQKRPDERFAMPKAASLRNISAIFALAVMADGFIMSA